MNAIELKSLSKHYRQYDKPILVFKEWLFKKSYHTFVEALAPVDLIIPKGITFGVVGDNGAGKSTLLKLMANTITPSAGSVTMNGRFSAILELGSGFHPEFSGIENIRMSCSMLGLSKQETDKRMPEIIAFSELGEAVNRPVKTYSSGMFVRLAFSVVTSVDPDILIVDEALSVGDANFQKKSMNRMMGFREAGKTLVFCSHNLYQVKELCDQAVWLDKGQVRLIGNADDVVDKYQDFIRSQASVMAKPQQQEAKNSHNVADVYIDDVCLLGGIDTANDLKVFETGKPFAVEVSASKGSHKLEDIHLGIVIIRNDGLQVYGTSTVIDGAGFTMQEDNKIIASLVFDQLQLMSGEYALEVWLIDNSSMHVYDSRPSCSRFIVRHKTTEVGICWMDHHWE